MEIARRLNSGRTIAEYRIQKDLETTKANISNSIIICVDSIDGNLLHLEALITGPKDTQYEDNVLQLNIRLSEAYPPPISILFHTPMTHPNVDERGVFLSSLLTEERWTPTMTIEDILAHVWSTLAFPDINSDQSKQNHAAQRESNNDQV